MSKIQINTFSSEERFQTLFNNIPIPAYIWQKFQDDLILINYNVAAKEITNFKIKDVLGIKASELYKDRPEILHELYRCANEKVNFSREMDYSYITTDVKKILSVNYSFIPPDLVLVHTEDITKRKLVEEKLKKSEKKYRNERDNLINILNNVKDGVYIVNQQYDIGYINPSLVKEFGPFKGKKCYNYFHNTIKACPWCKNQEVFTGKTIRREWYSPKNQQFYDLVYTPLKNLDGSISKLVIFHNITERKKYEKELKKMSRLKSELLRRSSHELKTPLVSIKGNVDFLLNLHYKKLDVDTIAILKEIKEGCGRLENLIKNLLESSKLESGHMQLKTSEEDLAFLIKFCINELKALINTRNQKINLEIHEKLITKFEKEKIYEVVSNLLINAIKYTPPNGAIKIKSEIKENSYIISVEDNGIGFNEEEKKRIFKRFGKIERYGQGWDLGIEGSGLGLYISKKILELHGGKIWVESEGRNKGSTFYFSLPIIKK